MKKAVIISADGFRDEELVYPFIRMEEGGVEAHIATRDKKIIQSEHGFPISKLYPIIVDTRTLKPKNYDLLILPGGLYAPDTMRGWEEVLEFVRSMHASKKVIAAICHGPWVLISAGIMTGKKATCHQNMRVDLENAGAIYKDAPVVHDGNLITSRCPRDLYVFTKSVIEAISELA